MSFPCECNQMSDDPLMHAISIVKEHNRPVWSYMETILNGDKFVEEELHNIKQAIHDAPPSATKSRTYINLNPTLEVHPLYTDCTTTIPDYLRISFTRFRTSSHMLRVETGRWSRTPRDERLCQCGMGVQNEDHVFVCPLVSNIAGSLSRHCLTPKEFFEDTSLEDLKVLHKMLDFMSNFQTESASD